MLEFSSMVLPAPSPYLLVRQPLQHNNNNNNCFTALCPGLPGWAGTRRNTHPPNHPDHHPIFISFFHLLRSIASSLFKLRAWQSFCTTSLHVLFGLPLGLEPPPHIPYVSSPNQCLLFAAHAHTIATCFAVVSKFYHQNSYTAWKMRPKVGHRKHS